MYSYRNSRLGGNCERTIIENNSLHLKLLAAKLRGASTSNPLKGIGPPTFSLPYVPLSTLYHICSCVKGQLIL
jgi:hypothetical protein